MKNKKVIFICSLLAIGVLSYSFFKEYKESSPVISKAKEKPQLRVPSSTPAQTIAQKLTPKKKLLSEEEIKIQEKITKILEQEDFDVKLENIGTKLHPKFSRTILFNHYKVVLRSKKNHMQSSYDALIDPSNGNIVRTWNKTQFEYPQKITFNTEGREYNP